MKRFHTTASRSNILLGSVCFTLVTLTGQCCLRLFWDAIGLMELWKVINLTSNGWPLPIWSGKGRWVKVLSPQQSCPLPLLPLLLIMAMLALFRSRGHSLKRWLSPNRLLKLNPEMVKKVSIVT